MVAWATATCKSCAVLQMTTNGALSSRVISEKPQSYIKPLEDNMKNTSPMRGEGMVETG